MTMWRRLLCGVAVLALAACGEAAPTAGEPTAFGAVCDKANDGQRVAVEGYLLFPDTFTGDDSVVLRLYETDDFDGTPIGATVPFGTGANQVEMVASEYTDADLRVHTQDDQVTVLGDQVRISGTVYFPLVDQDFECGLSNPFVERAGG